MQSQARRHFELFYKSLFVSMQRLSTQTKTYCSQRRASWAVSTQQNYNVTNIWSYVIMIYLECIDITWFSEIVTAIWSKPFFLHLPVIKCCTVCLHFCDQVTSKYLRQLIWRWYILQNKSQQSCKYLQSFNLILMHTLKKEPWQCYLFTTSSVSLLWN